MITFFDPPDFFESHMTCCVATAIVGSAVVGAGASVAGASMQAGATKKASDVQERMYQQTREDLLPYNTAGQDATKMLSNRLTELTSPITMDQATLEKTPGYQFNLTQGLKSTQNSAAARGLGTSGAALKGAATFATGLADSTYQNQFNNANTNKNNAFNYLLGTAQLGTSAAGQYGANATSAGNADLTNSASVGSTISGNMIGAGNAQAAADIATGKNIGNAISGAAGSYASAPSNNPFGNYAQENAGASGSAYYGPVAPGKSMYGR